MASTANTMMAVTLYVYNDGKTKRLVVKDAKNNYYWLQNYSSGGFCTDLAIEPITDTAILKNVSTAAAI